MITTTTERENLTQLRARAAERGDLAETLRLDDTLEDHGMHGDDRRTCHTCQSWADHSHNPLTGARIRPTTKFADLVEYPAFDIDGLSIRLPAGATFALIDSEEVGMRRTVAAHEDGHLGGVVLDVREVKGQAYVDIRFVPGVEYTLTFDFDTEVYSHRVGE
jgi:hypothetical protein